MLIQGSLSRRTLLTEALVLGSAMTMGALANSTLPRTAGQETSARPEQQPDALHIAALQMTSAENDQEANLRKGEQFCRWARERGADLALFPEMWNIGYTPFRGVDAETVAAWQRQAVARDSQWVEHFRKLAIELGMAIAVTYLEAWPEAPRNSLTLFDRNGQEVLTYAKVHTCDFSNFEAATTPGTEFLVRDLETAKGQVAIGAMICFDREFPESARILMHHGAELILCPNACLLDDLRIAQFRVRALENSIGAVMTNYPAPFMNGRSVGFDVAGTEMMHAPAEEGIYSALFDLPAMRSYRQTTIWGNAFRRPHRYGSLTEPAEGSVWKRETGLGIPFQASKR